MNAQTLRELANEVKAKEEKAKVSKAENYVKNSIIPMLEKEANLGLYKKQIVIPYDYEVKHIIATLEELNFKTDYKGNGNILIQW